VPEFRGNLGVYEVDLPGSAPVLEDGAHPATQTARDGRGGVWRWGVCVLVPDWPAG
jgi:hypothetical protein